MSKIATSPNRTPGPKVRRSVARPADGREHILDTATRLFSEQGIAATTVAQIARAAGVTSAMVHYYFINRETLLDVIVEERIARVFDYVWAPASDPAYDDPFLLVEQFVQRIIEMARRMPWFPALWIREIVNEGGLLRERVIPRLPREQIKRFGHRVAAGQQEGSINDQIAPELLFTSVLALVMMPLAAAKVLQQSLAFPSFDHDALRRHAMALLLGGMQPPDPHRSLRSTSEDSR